jgi:hypothetical protein
MWLVLASLLRPRDRARTWGSAIRRPGRGGACGRQLATGRVAPPHRHSVLRELRESFASPLVGSLGAIAIVISLGANVTDYQLDLALKRAMPRRTRMIGFLARLRLFAGVGAFVGPGLCRRSGHGAVRGAAPLMILPRASVSAAWGSLSARCPGAPSPCRAPRTSRVKYSVNDSAFNLLFLPRRADARCARRRERLIDGKHAEEPPGGGRCSVGTLPWSWTGSPAGGLGVHVGASAVLRRWSRACGRGSWLVRAERRDVFGAGCRASRVRRFNPAAGRAWPLSRRGLAGRGVGRFAAAAPIPQWWIHALTSCCEGDPRGRRLHARTCALLHTALPNAVRGEGRCTLDAMARRVTESVRVDCAGLRSQERSADDDGAMVREAAIRAYGTALGARAVPACRRGFWTRERRTRRGGRGAGSAPAASRASCTQAGLCTRCSAPTTNRNAARARTCWACSACRATITRCSS